MRIKNSVRWTVMASKEEKDALDEAAQAAGVTRNRFIRLWIATLPRGKARG